MNTVYKKCIQVKTIAGVLSSDLSLFPFFQRVLQTFFIYAWRRIAINYENFPARYVQQILPSFAS